MNNNSFEHEILTVNQVAEYLQLSEMTTYKLVQEGRIPAFKIGRHWRIKKTDLNNLIDQLVKGENL
ncbi:MAG: helix-turn-helix domain-containing protein [Peptostreptococcaceae bacterium]|nr:helix-turn-helix domain-containing protein [Peptostreptococcaceae bacterium]